MAINQSTQSDIVHLTILLPDGEKIGIKRLFDEINIFENVLFPCMSGNIVIRDALGLASKINFDGSERLRISITKDYHMAEQSTQDGGQLSPIFDRTFVIYKMTDRSQLTQNSEIYTLHFVSEEFLLSQQKSIRKSYTGTYTDIVRTILTDELKVGENFGEISNIYTTKGIHTVHGNNMSPIQLIEYITKRASSNEGVPDLMFWQSRNGFNFMPISTIVTFETIHKITFAAKNITESIGEELFGVRDFKILSGFNSAENISSGVYAGTFIGFDPLTRTIKTTKLNYDDVYKLSPHANAKGINTKIYNKENKNATDMYDSRITLYPYQSSRTTNTYIKDKDSATSNIIDDAHNYILQRKQIFANLLQKRIRVVMPGNFDYLSGALVEAMFPKQYNVKDTDTISDDSLRGKYMIVGIRHIVRYDKHETILEIATDSTNYGAK